MATFLVRMTIYDPGIIAALNSLKRSRKQSAFLVEALRQFLSAEGGQDLLIRMSGSTNIERSFSSLKEIYTTSGDKLSSCTDLDDIFRR